MFALVYMDDWENSMKHRYLKRRILQSIKYESHMRMLKEIVKILKLEI